MAGPGSLPNIVPGGDDWLGQRLADLQRQIDELKSAAQPLAIVSRDFDGTLDPPAVGSKGWALTSDGKVIISSDLLLGGDLIGDDALQNPARFGNDSADVNSTNLTVAGGDLAVITHTVPAGFTRAQVMCFVTVGNTRLAGAGGFPFYIQAWISGSGSAVIAATCADGSSASLSAAWTQSLSGLTPGSHIQMGAWGAVDDTTGWSPGGANAHAVSSVIWLR